MSRRGLLGAAALAFLPRSARAEEPLAVLGAAAARILPSADGPGAREAKVERFLEKQLATDLAEVRLVFEQLARLLDLWAQKSGGASFVALAPEAQDRVLGELSRGEIPVRAFPQQLVFRAFHSVVIEGFLSDPAHGGNDRMIGWKFVGFPEPHLRRPGGHGHH